MIAPRRRQGIAQSLPRKVAKIKIPTRHGVAFWIEREGGFVLLRRRPEKGLLGGMMEFPSTPWLASSQRKNRAAHRRKVEKTSKSS